MLLGAWPRPLRLQGALTLRISRVVREGVLRQAKRRHRGCRKVPQATALKQGFTMMVDGSSANLLGRDHRGAFCLPRPGVKRLLEADLALLLCRDPS